MSLRSFVWRVACLTLVLTFCFETDATDAVAAEPIRPANDAVDFARDIRPILSNHCWSCHGPDEQARKAGLRLDLPKSATATLESGSRAIDPADLAQSELLSRITSMDESEVMPPPNFKKPLTTRQIELLRRWVAQGAKYADHWAFVAPMRPALPAVKDATWPREPLDYFVLQRLEAEGMRPNPVASHETLLRRVTYDLTGLPPTVEDLDAFLADASPEAYERVVDRLLTSPQYAERMAVQWLDAARYADTNGYNNDEERSMWPWRDWVIKAFAENMPYDRFLVEQLAGDLLPSPTLAQRVATGFNRNHVLTTEGGIIEEEYRVEYVADRVHTTSTVFLGLSFQCARCHDHKFDPMTQRDYYRFFAFFNNVSDKLVGYNKGGSAEPFVASPTAEQQLESARLKQAKKSLEQQLATRADNVQPLIEQWEQSLSVEQKQIAIPAGQLFAVAFDEAQGDRARIVEAQGQGASTADAKTGSIKGKSTWKPGKLAGALEFDGQTHVDCGQLGVFDKGDRVSFGAWIFPTSQSPSAVITKMDDGQGSQGFDLIIEGGKPAVHLIHRWPENGLKVIARQPMSLNAWHHVMATWNGSGQATGVKIYVDGQPQELDVVGDKLRDSIKTEQPLRIGQRSGSCAFQGLIDEVRFFQSELSADDVKRLADGQSLATLAEIFETAPEKRTDQQREQLRKYYLDVVDAESRRWKTELAQNAERQKQLEQSIPKMMVMAELPQPRVTRLLNRGQYDQPGDAVEAGVAAFLTSLPDDAPPNRLGLARWLTSSQHPLTARVAINRWWSGLFGTGIVETVEDFGTQGAFPSHPELLDYLATELIRSHWNLRAVLKQIVMSATYRQSSQATLQQMERDPHNRLLGRGSRFRFPAETLRDGALAVSGLLSQRVGGPSVKPYQPAGLWEEVSVERRYKYVVDEGDARYRRSMYTFWKRTCPPPAMTTFDAPDRETCLVRRARTNTPLQALVMLNDPTYVEASRQLALRIIHAGNQSSEQRLKQACRISLGRAPTTEEQQLLLELLQNAQQRFVATPAAVDQLLPIAGEASLSSVNRTEWAAWTTLCSVLLNLDEAVTRH